MGRSEELGTGLRNVFKYSKAYSGSDNVIFLEEDVFIVKVPLVSDVTDNVTDRVPNKVTDNVTDKATNRVTNKVPNKVTNKVTNNQKIILENINQNNRISINELALKVGISTRKVKENIHKLKVLGKLKRIGPTKGGHWEVI
jgi:ATP-dependent DNA helicase RecG